MGAFPVPISGKMSAVIAFIGNETKWGHARGRTPLASAHGAPYTYDTLSKIHCIHGGDNRQQHSENEMREIKEMQHSS
jgi:hypothetical protein